MDKYIGFDIDSKKTISILDSRFSTSIRCKCIGTDENAI